MAIDPGTQLGAFEVLSPLGAGGMGEVYRAKDGKLGREVALKLLPDELARDSERLARFAREAQLLAALNHPNVASIYGLEESDARQFLVLELVEGEDLAARVARGPVPIPEALEIGRQIAEALEAAHEKGIVHRDLKPANVKLTPDGVVKVLDFGLAKAYLGDVEGVDSSSDLSQSPTLARAGTQAGALLGTAAYMSPEQARGRGVDKRSDIWAFGVVLFELLTGQSLFAGETASDTLAGILKEDPDWSRLPANTPRRLSDLLRRCLRREKRRRLHDIADARLEIEELLAGGNDEGDVPVTPAAKGGASQRERLAWALAVVLPALAALATWGLGRPAAAPSAPVVSLSLVPPEGVGLSLTGDYPGPPVLSPDGTMVAFCAVGEEGLSYLWVRELSRRDARRLPGTDGAFSPFWSPDGRSLGYFSDVSLRRVDLDGGMPLQLSAATASGKGGTWSANDVIVYSPTAQDDLYAIPAAGGTPKKLTQRDAAHTTHRWPQFLPDGERFLFLAADHGDPLGEAMGVYVGSLDGSPPRRLVRAEASAILASGFLLYPQGGSLMVQRWDTRAMEPLGPPQPSGIDILVDGTTWLSGLSASDTGLLTYVPPGPVGGYALRWYARDGTPLETVGPDANYQTLVLSDDGRRVLLSTQFDRPSSDVWVYDLEQGTETRLTFAVGGEEYPTWGPGPDSFTYQGEADGIFAKSLAGSSPERLVYKPEDERAWPLSWSPDGRYLVFGTGNPFAAFAQSLQILDVERGGRVTRWLDRRGEPSGATFSPDGRFLAYTSSESGRSEVYVARFVPPDDEGQMVDAGKWQISRNGGSRPRWRPDGRELYYIGPDGRFVAARVEASAEGFRVAGEEALFRVMQRRDANAYGATADGQRFLLTTLSSGSTRPVPVIVNWPELFAE